MQLSNKQYNFIKWLITIFLPAVGALYFALAQAWDLHQYTGINGTINAIIAFLGLLIGYSTRQYNKTEQSTDTDGQIIVGEVDGEKHLGLAVNSASIDSMADKTIVKFEVVNKTVLPPAPDVPSVDPGANSSGSVGNAS